MLGTTPLKQLAGYCDALITPIEVDLMRQLFVLRSLRWFTWLCRTASRLGDWPLWVVTAVGLLAFDEPWAWSTLLAGLLAVGTTVLLFVLIKNLVGRPRPSAAGHGLSALAAAPDRFSFPSGHTMTAFAVWGSLSAGLPAAGPYYLVVACLIGLSRVFLGLHYPTDVLVGALLGGSLGLSLGGWLVEG
ncbi:MAG: phosphatase PAP2 family protein [Desulfuromonadales bacterium]|nr:phosphatase PAP2 family protein [Desulfuromonadales bacterium]